MGHSPALMQLVSWFHRHYCFSLSSPANKVLNWFFHIVGNTKMWVMVTNVSFLFVYSTTELTDFTNAVSQTRALDRMHVSTYQVRTWVCYLNWILSDTYVSMNVQAPVKSARTVVLELVRYVLCFHIINDFFRLSLLAHKLLATFEVHNAWQWTSIKCSIDSGSWFMVRFLS